MWRKIWKKYTATSKSTKTTLFLWIFTLFSLIVFVVIVGTFTATSKQNSGGYWNFQETAVTKKAIAEGQGSTVPPEPLNVKNLKTWKKTSAGKKLSKYWAGTTFAHQVYTSEAKSASNMIAIFATILALSLTVALFTTGIIVYEAKKPRLGVSKND